MKTTVASRAARSAAVVLSYLACYASGFSIPDGLHILQTSSSTIAAASSAQLPLHETFENIYAQYQNALTQHPLPTQVATGASLAVVGDAIAQSKNMESGEQQGYDTRRAISFAVFDMAYRVLQHAIFPWIAANCQGQVLGSVPLLADNVDPFVLSTTEMTLCNQLGVIPTVYYPIYFWISGAIQGLTLEASILRAQNMFIPIMKRNLLFWIPVQFVQFGYVPEEYWIPSSCVAGLAWTIILSLFAGSATKTAPATAESNSMEDMLARQAAEGAAASSAEGAAAATAAGSRQTASEARV